MAREGFSKVMYSCKGSISSNVSYTQLQRICDWVNVTVERTKKHKVVILYGNTISDLRYVITRTPIRVIFREEKDEKDQRPA